MTTLSEQYLLIADSHLSGGKPEEEFFAMLDGIAELPPAVGVVFLGDIFELWFALARYEDESHVRFLAWCAHQKEIREVLFTEGNHEFYLAENRAAAFSEVARREIRRGGIVFNHGDRMNRRDVLYTLLRVGVRNAMTRFLLYLTGPAFGPKLTQGVRLSLKGTNSIHKKKFPRRDMKRYLSDAKSRAVHDIFVGHFHDRRDFERDGVRLHALPAFLNSYEIGRCLLSGELAVGPWREILAEVRKSTGDLRS